MARLTVESHSNFYKDPPEFPTHIYLWDDKKVIRDGVQTVSFLSLTYTVRVSTNQHVTSVYITVFVINTLQAGLVAIDNPKVTWQSLINVYNGGWEEAQIFFCEFMSNDLILFIVLL